MPVISRRVVIAAVLTISGCVTPNRNAASRVGPPMWRVERGTSSVTLFGQVPIPKGISWLKPEIEAAFNASQEVWFENPDFDLKTAGPAIQKRIAVGGPTLGETIGEADRKRLAAALTKIGRAPDAFDGQLTWQAYMSVSELADLVSGMDPASLPERILKPRGKAEGKLIRSEWASMEEIMSFSSQQTLSQQLQLISRTLDDIHEPDETRRRAEAWARGDISHSVAQDEHFSATYPELAARLVVERNKRWVPRIQDMLARNSATFVCVGLGHLVGQHSIQRYLEQAGLKSIRV